MIKYQYKTLEIVKDEVELPDDAIPLTVFGDLEAVPNAEMTSDKATDLLSKYRNLGQTRQLAQQLVRHKIMLGYLVPVRE